MSDIPVRYGLTPEIRATVIQRRSEGASWELIAREVNWHAPTLLEHLSWGTRAPEPFPGPGCRDLDPDWPDTNNRPRGPRLCATYPRCLCGEGRHRMSSPGDGLAKEIKP